MITFRSKRGFLPLVVIVNLSPVHAADVIKANNTDSLDLTTSWVGGVAPGLADVGLWNNTVTAANTTALGADTDWAGIRVVDPGGLVTINGANMLYLGASGIDLSAATQDLALANGTTLDAPQTWNTATGRTLTLTGAFSNAGNSLTVAGAGNTNLASGAFSGAGALTKTGAGTLKLGGTGVSFSMDAGTLIDIQGGILRNDAGASNNWSANLSSLATATGATFDVWDADVTVDALTGSAGTIQKGTTGTHVLKIGVNDGGGTYSGTIKQVAGVFTVEKRGTGSQTFAGSIDNKNLLVSASNGTLILGKASSGPGVSGIGKRAAYGVADIASGATLRLAGTGGEQIYGFVVAGIPGSGSVNMSGGILEFTGLNEGWNALTGTGTVRNATAATTSTMTLGDNGGSGIFDGNIVNGSGTMALIKKGAGTQTLGGTNTYTGATTVSAGTLEVKGSVSGSVISVANGATLGGEGTVGAVTLGSAAPGARISVDPATPAALSTGALTINGTASVSPSNSDITPGTPFKVLSFTSKGNAWTTASFAMLNPANYRSAVFSEAASAVSVTIGGISIAWNNASADSKWNTNGSVNFQDSVPANQKFFAFDSVLFDDLPGTDQVITVDGAQQPASVTVNSSLNYTFTNGTAGAIVGKTSLLKSGTGTLTINLANTFTGGTTINGGILSIASDAALGTAPEFATAGHLAIDGGTLRLASAFNPGASRGIAIGGGGATLDTSPAGSSATVDIASDISGTGNLTLAANGDTADGGGGAGGLSLTGSVNDFIGDVSITSGVVTVDSFFGDSSNKIILDGGGLVDRNINFNFPADIEIGPAGGVYRTNASVSTSTLSGAITSTAYTTFKHTEGGTIWLDSDGSGYTGSFDNKRGNVRVSALDAAWQNTDFIQDTNGGWFEFRGTGTATVNSFASTRDVFLNYGTQLDADSGAISMASNGHWWQTNAGALGQLTSSSGTLTITNGGATTNLGTLDHQIRVLIKDFDGVTPLALVKNNDNQLALTQPNTYTGGTTINGGRVQATNLQSFGTGPVTVNSGGQAFLSASGSVANNFTIAGDGVTEAAGTLGALRLENSTISGQITVAPAGARMTAHNASTGTIAGPLAGSGNLELNSNAASNNGTINISGNSSSYSGVATISQGLLNLQSATFGGSIVVANNAMLNGECALAGDLTLGTGGTASLAFNPVSAAALTTAGALTVNGTVSVNLGGAVPTSGSYKVIEFGSKGGSWSAANFTTPGSNSFRPGTGFVENANDVSMTIVKLALEWNNVAGNSIWDTNNTVNFRDSVPANQKFYWGDDVLFGNIPTTAQTVVINGTLQPSSITVNSSNAYTFNNGTSGVIAGGTSLLKAGTGLLSINLANTFTGGLVIRQGEVRTSVNGAVGTGTITLGDSGTGSANVGWLFNGSGTPSNNVLVSGDGTGTATIGTYSSGSYTTPSGSLTLNRATILQDGTADRTTFTGKISGTPGSITLAGSRITFANSTNDFVGNIVVGATTIYQNDAAGAIPDTTNFTLSGSGSRFRLNSNSETIGAISGSGIIDNVTGAGNTLTLGGGGGSGIYTGSVINGSGVLNIAKTGSGTQYLSGTNTYTGTTVVNGGALFLSGGQNAGSITVADGATLGIAGTAGSQLTAGSLILGSTAGATLSIQNFGAAMPPLSVTSDFTVNGPITVLVGGALETGTFPLIFYPFGGSIGGDGFPALSLGTLPRSVSATLVDNPGNSSVDLDVTVNPLKWKGNDNSTWDIDTTSNWLLSAASAKYLDGDIVVFDDSATGGTSVTLNVPVAPTSLTFDNSVLNYSIAGGGNITGSCGITKSGTGSLTLSTANSYLGLTLVNAGTLIAGGPAAFGAAGTASLAFGPDSTGVVKLNGNSMSVRSLGTDLLVGTPAIESGSGTAGTDVLTVSNGSNNTFEGVLRNGSTRTLGLLKDGTGTLTLGGPDSNTHTGPTTLTGTGQLVLAKTDGAVAVSGDLYMSASGVRAIVSTARDNQFGPGCVLRFTGTQDTRLEIKGTTQTLGGIDNSTVTSSVYNCVQHSEFGAPAAVDGTSELVLDVTGSNSYSFNTLAPVNGAMRDYNGGVLGLVKRGTGTQTLLGNAIDYTGPTSVEQGKLILSNNDDTWTSAYTIAAGATVEVNRTSGVDYEHRNAFTLSGAGTFEKTGNGLMDMNWDKGGTVAMSSGALIHVKEGTLRLGYGGISVWSANKADLTLAAGTTFDFWDNNNAGVFVDALNGSGNITRSNYAQTSSLTVGVDNGTGTFSGVISNASGTTNVVKTGTGIQTLTGANTYSGTTTVNGGTLRVNNTTGSGTGTGAVTVATGGTLGGTGAVSGAVTVNTGGTLAAGASIESLATGALTMAAGSTFAVEFNSSGAPVADVTNVSGNVSLAGVLSLTDIAPVPAAIALGTKLTILTYSGTLSGTFAGLAEGATVTAGPNSFKIRYSDSNAVTLESVAGGSGYATWAGLKGLTGANNGLTQDPDNDGVSNLMEFYLDGNPLSSDSSILPVSALDATHLTLTFKRLDDAELDVASQSVQFGAALATWTSSTIGAIGSGPDANGVIVLVLENSANPDDVTVKIPRTHAVDGKLFGRIKVTK